MKAQSQRQNPILVVAAIIVDHDQVLVTQRVQGSHMAGKWEFPGGKIEPGEDPREALQRELREELGIETTVGSVVETVLHRYTEKSVLLLFYRAQIAPLSPEIRCRGVAAWQWRSASELASDDFPPADVAVLDLVRRVILESR